MKRRRETPADASRPKRGRENSQKGPEEVLHRSDDRIRRVISAPPLPPKSQSFGTNAVRLARW